MTLSCLPESSLSAAHIKTLYPLSKADDRQLQCLHSVHSQMSPRCASLALKHYLLKPVQRIPQYQLLLTGTKTPRRTLTPRSGLKSSQVEALLNHGALFTGLRSGLSCFGTILAPSGQTSKCFDRKTFNMGGM